MILNDWSVFSLYFCRNATFVASFSSYNKQVLKLLKYILLAFTALYSLPEGFSQLSADCFSATPVCQTIYNVNSLSPAPTNNVTNEINTTLTCLSSGETNGVWYTFTVQTTGILSFNIVPNNPTDDYDWALFDLTNNVCADLPNMASISCNYSNSVTNGGTTGPNGGPNNQDEPTLNVLAGETFVLFISNYTGSGTGYRLDFSASTATIPDNTVPALLSALPSDSCGATSIILEFSENIACNSLNPGDFTLTDPGGNPVTVTTISGCGSGYSETFDLNISPAMTETGNYTLTLTGTISDICGNALNGPLVFNIANTALDVTVNVTNATCGNNDGSANVTINGGQAPFSYLWDNGSTVNPVTGLPRGNHWVTVGDARGCSVTVNFYVSDPTSFTFTLQATADTCNKGSGVISANVVGTTAPYTYDFGGFQVGLNSSFPNAIGDSTYIVIVTDNMNCWWPDTITVPNILNDSLQAFFSVSDEEIDFLFPYATFYNQSENEVAVDWLIDGGHQFGNSFQYQFPTYGDYPVSIIAIDQNGCRDTFTMSVTVKVLLSLFIPTAITANDDGLNEIFYVEGFGMDSTTFQLSIFDSFGREIFSTTDVTQGWDGRSVQGSKSYPQDVYVYRVFVRDIYGNPYIRNGMITVIR